MEKEYGGYLEYPMYNNKIIHANALPLNFGRNCLRLLIQEKHIKMIWLPKYICNSVVDVCEEENVEIKYYSIDKQFLPILDNFKMDEWIYICNYYGQVSREKLSNLHELYINMIVDNVQAFFESPITGVDTLYSCRKWFGCSDGAFLYSDIQLRQNMEIDISGERMNYVIGRYETGAQSYYKEYVSREDKIATFPIKKMSKFTLNLLCSLDYAEIKKNRNENFEYLENGLNEYNEIDVKPIEGAFMYPLLMKDGNRVKRELIKRKIYVPTFWSEVLDRCKENEYEYKLANDLVLLPVDQRYTRDDMQYIIDNVLNIIREEQLH